MLHKNILAANPSLRKPVGSEPADSRRKNPSSGSVILTNRRAIFTKFDKYGTLPRSLAATYGTPERVVCEIVRSEYREIIERVRRAS